MTIDHAVLQTEITTDPQSVGYSGATSDQGVADLLNTRGAGTTPATLEPEFADAADVLGAVVLTEYEALSLPRRQIWDAFMALAVDGALPVKHANLRSLATDIWNSTTTLANLQALQTRQASRAEALFGENVTVNAKDVAQADGRS